MVTEEQKKRYNELLKVRNSIHERSNKQMLRIILISLVIGILIGLFIVSLAIKADKAGTLDIDMFMLCFYGSLVLFIILFILHIILHEAGHLVFGLISGYRFLSYRIYSIIFYKKDGQIHKKKYSIKGTVGQCLMYPPERCADGSFPFVLYNLGGGISNLLFSLPFVVPAILTHSTYSRVIYLMFLFSGILTAANNIIPMNVGIPNDGMNLKSMLKDKCMQEAFYLQLKVNAEMSDGKQITDYSPEVFALPEGTDDTNMLTTFARLYSYYQQIAFHNYELAERMLTTIEKKSAQYQPAIINILDAERLFFMVINHSHLEEIAAVNKHSRLVLATAKTNIGIQRVKYIYEVFMTEDEKKDIITLITKKLPKRWRVCDQEKLYQDFLKLAENFPVSGEAAMYLEMVEYIRSNNPVNRENHASLQL